jgi:hypothetical protein
MRFLASNRDEFLAGTNPTDPASTLPLLAIEWSGADVRLRFSSMLGKRYQLQQATTLAAEGWTDVGSVRSGTGSLLQITHPNDNHAQRFYRVRVEYRVVRLPGMSVHFVITQWMVLRSFLAVKGFIRKAMLSMPVASFTSSLSIKLLAGIDFDLASSRLRTRMVVGPSIKGLSMSVSTSLISPRCAKTRAYTRLLMPCSLVKVRTRHVAHLACVLHWRNTLPV